MQSKNKESMANPAAELVKNREAIAKLAASSDARQLMEMLGRMGGVQQAAKAAAGGDTGALVSMVERLMQSEDGAKLAQSISQKAKQAGLE